MEKGYGYKSSIMHRVIRGYFCQGKRRNEFFRWSIELTSVWSFLGGDFTSYVLLFFSMLMRVYLAAVSILGTMAQA